VKRNKLSVLVRFCFVFKFLSLSPFGIIIFLLISSLRYNYEFYVIFKILYGKCEKVNVIIMSFTLSSKYCMENVKKLI